jgi:hypothetical protein
MGQGPVNAGAGGGQYPQPGRHAVCGGKAADIDGNGVDSHERALEQ